MRESIRSIISWHRHSRKCVGHTLRAEVDITTDPTLNITRADDLAHYAEAHLLANVRRLAAAAVHVSPAGVHHGKSIEVAHPQPPTLGPPPSCKAARLAAPTHQALSLRPRACPVQGAAAESPPAS
jgi:hypothetical protein